MAVWGICAAVITLAGFGTYWPGRTLDKPESFDMPPDAATGIPLIDPQTEQIVRQSRRGLCFGVLGLLNLLLLGVVLLIGSL